MADHDWRYDDILIALKLKGYSLYRVAKEMGITYPAARYQVRMGSTEEIRAFICGLLGVEPWEVYGSRYPTRWRESGPPKRE